jgi:hydrogenase expression/formation protein HypD
LKFVAEYRKLELVENLKREINKSIKSPCSIMEICGGQTHTIMKYNISELLPEMIGMIHGPGCPVCVTPLEKIDKAIRIALNPEVIFTTYGDMMRVPGSAEDLLSVKAEGGDVRMVYSPLDAVQTAVENPEKNVVFFGVGFETTAPANAAAIIEAERLGLKNFFLLSSHVRVPPAIELLLEDSSSRIDGILAAGHVCTIMGHREYEKIVEKYNVPIVITGFEPVDILQGILMVIKQLEGGMAELENQYSRAVTKEGNRIAQQLMNKVFCKIDMKWRGLGTIPMSGLGINEEYSCFDAEKNMTLSISQQRKMNSVFQDQFSEGTINLTNVQNLELIVLRKTAWCSDGFFGRSLCGLL